MKINLWSPLLREGHRGPATTVVRSQKETKGMTRREIQAWHRKHPPVYVKDAEALWKNLGTENTSRMGGTSRSLSRKLVRYVDNEYEDLNYLESFCTYRLSNKIYYGAANINRGIVSGNRKKKWRTR
jgi:hypothetical protein